MPGQCWLCQLGQYSGTKKQRGLNIGLIINKKGDEPRAQNNLLWDTCFNIDTPSAAVTVNLLKNQNAILIVTLWGLYVFVITDV
jgi:hypothetical protein